MRHYRFHYIELNEHTDANGFVQMYDYDNVKTVEVTAKNINLAKKLVRETVKNFGAINYVEYIRK